MKTPKDQSIAKRVHAYFAIAALCLLGPFQALAESQPPNILMIVVDDLKPSIGAYGDTFAITPQIDRLAASGTTFLNNHCQQAVCGASRASALTGLRPDTVQVWDFKSKMRDKLPELVTLPQYFKQRGYHTASIGKIFDPRCCDGRTTNDAVSWSQPHWTADTPHLSLYHYGADTNSKDITECLPHNVEDNFYGDGLRTEEAIRFLKKRKEMPEPFLLAVGFKKPHLPFVAPKKYWDLYDREKVPLAAFQDMPNGAPTFSFQDSWELRSGYNNIPKGKLPTAMQRELIHGYYACVSYIDTQVGKLLEALDELQLDENTIIVLWGDHGWHLGDHGMWCKHTNYEQATRSPLILMDPRNLSPVKSVSKPTEFLDIFPTLVELSGFEPIQGLQGKSLTEITRNSQAAHKAFAVSQYPRSFNAPNNLMGYAFRDERYRLITWIEMDYKNGERSGPLIRTELYDYQTDPTETTNLATSEKHAALHGKLLQKTHDFARSTLGISWTKPSK